MKKSSNNTDVYQYLYDGNGRLSTIRKNGNNISAYKYDIYRNILQEISSFNTLTFYMDYEKERLLDIQYKIQKELIVIVLISIMSMQNLD